MPSLKTLSRQDTKFEKAFFLPAIIFLLILLVSLFFLKPKISSIVKAKRDLANDKKILAELTKKLATLEGLSKLELTEKVVLSLKVLPAEKDVATGIFVLKKMAINSGLVVSELSIPEVGEIATASAETTKGDRNEILPSLEIKLMAIGEGEKITNFLKEIEKTAPLMRVNDLKINQEKELDEAEIGLNYYFLPLPKTLGKTEQSVSPITPEEEKVFEKINEFTLMETIGVSAPAPLGKSDLFNY